MVPKAPLGCEHLRLSPVVFGERRRDRGCAKDLIRPEHGGRRIGEQRRVGAAGKSDDEARVLAEFLSEAGVGECVFAGELLVGRDGASSSCPERAEEMLRITDGSDVEGTELRKTCRGLVESHLVDALLHILERASKKRDAPLIIVESG